MTGEDKAIHRLKMEKVISLRASCFYKHHTNRTCRKKLLLAPFTNISCATDIPLFDLSTKSSPVDSLWAIYQTVQRIHGK